MNDEKRIDLLNNLICVNKDRNLGCERALGILASSQYRSLEPIFNQRIHESKVFIYQLSEFITKLGGRPIEIGSINGKIYRAWLALKSLFLPRRLNILFEECEFTEGIAWRAYDKALAKEIWPKSISVILTSHWHAIKHSHDVLDGYIAELKEMSVQNI
jgi:uncharacterized protein (TIGR02284 family)